MAAVRLVAPDGRQGLPVFTGLDVLTSWDDAARPLPLRPHLPRCGTAGGGVAVS